MTDFPVLNETPLTKVELRARDVFYIWFFNFECLRQSYAGFHYDVKRWIRRDISTDEWNVIYKFSAVGHLDEARFVFNSNDPFKTRHQISTQFARLEEVFAHDRSIRNAKRVLAKIPKSSIDTLKSLNPEVLQTLMADAG